MDFHILDFAVWLIGGLVLCPPFMAIFKRAGWARWLGLLMIIPLANLLLLWAFAFSRWPAMSEEANKGYP
jgi:hypothetical protein